jgi:hypothetical protein
MPETPAWDRPLPRESAAAHARFQHYCQQGPARQLRITAQHFGLAPSTLTEQSRRFDWHRRAAAWDAEQAASTVVLPSKPATVAAVDLQGLDQEHWEALEEFRKEAEQLGRGQVRLARGLSAAATKNAAKLLQSDRQLSPRDIAALASTSAQLASSGTQLWAKAVGLDRLMAGMEHLAREAADAEP